MAELLQENPLEPQAQTGDDLAWQQAGVQNRVLRRLRRGHYSCADTIDLHHMTENTARQVLLDFLQQACNHGPGCVRVIHGKGLRSRDVPVLKRMTASLLRRHPRVMAFASCRPVDGGTGATDVLLRAARGEPS